MAAVTKHRNVSNFMKLPITAIIIFSENQLRFKLLLIMSKLIYK